MRQKLNDIRNKYFAEIVIFSMLAFFLIPFDATSLMWINAIILAMYYVIFRVKIYNKFDKEEKHPASESIQIQEPPSAMHPAVASYFVREKVDLNSVYGVLLSLVNRRKLKLHKEGDDYTFTLLDKEVPLLPIDEYVIDWLFGGSQKITTVNLEKDKDGSPRSIHLNGLLELESYLAQKNLHLAQGPKTTINMRDFKEKYTNKFQLDILFEHLQRIEPLLKQEVAKLIKDNQEEKRKMSKKIFKVTVPLFIVCLITAGIGIAFFYLFLGLFLYYKLTAATQKTSEGTIEHSKWNSYRATLEKRMDAERRSVNDIILWDHHLTYAVSLGVAEKALNELDWLQGNYVEVTNGVGCMVTTR